MEDYVGGVVVVLVVLVGEVDFVVIEDLVVEG